jgi:hypothetical protein
MKFTNTDRVEIEVWNQVYWSVRVRVWRVDEHVSDHTYFTINNQLAPDKNKIHQEINK